MYSVYTNTWPGLMHHCIYGSRHRVPLDRSCPLDGVVSQIGKRTCVRYSLQCGYISCATALYSLKRTEPNHTICVYHPRMVAELPGY